MIHRVQTDTCRAGHPVFRALLCLLFARNRIQERVRFFHSVVFGVQVKNERRQYSFCGGGYIKLLPAKSLENQKKLGGECPSSVCPELSCRHKPHPTGCDSDSNHGVTCR